MTSDTNNVWWKLRARTADRNFENYCNYSMWHQPSPCVYAATFVGNREAAVHTLTDLKALAPNWDGYGASSISDSTISNARYMLESIINNYSCAGIPEISPNPNGTVSFEWEIEDREVYVEIGKSRANGYLKSSNAATLYVQGSAAELTVVLPALLSFFNEPSRAVAPTITAFVSINSNDA